MAPNRSGWNAGQTRLAQVGTDVATEAPDGILRQGQRLLTPNGPPEVAVVVFWSQSYRVDPYSPAKITENRARLEIRTRLAPVGSDVATEAPDGILRQGQWLLTPN
ncbi:hypothetical protein CDL15_Pgr010261 [Punica granatum]|uniref:Uncharacterized protein n=1 Tax=Punica granatum TaxID=22663 RepID=A0A218WVM6_PUNGR|nr:hypothetical protein CDL15_Pgr010261 [Punica granatum]